MGVYDSRSTPWIAYTPVFGAGFGTVTGISFFSRRNGPNLEVRGKWTNGTVISNTASISVGHNGINGNVVIDTSRVAPVSIIGEYTGSLTSTTHFGGFPVAPGSNADNIGFTVLNSTTGYGTGAVVAAAFAASGSLNTVNFSVPIVGWT